MDWNANLMNIPGYMQFYTIADFSIEWMDYLIIQDK